MSVGLKGKRARVYTGCETGVGAAKKMKRLVAKVEAGEIA